MKKQSKIVSSICIGVFLMIFTFSIIQANKNQNTVQVSSSTALSNQKIGWGTDEL